jgi:hypothetical protein
MTTALIIVLVVAVIVLGTALVLSRSGKSTPEQPRPDVEGHSDLNGADEPSDHHDELVLRDDRGRELFAQIIDREDSMLFARADAQDGASGTPVAFDKMLDTVPALGAALHGGKWVRILNPEVLSWGEQMRSSAGGYLGGIRGDIHFVAQLRLSSPVDVRVVAAPLAVFKVASAVTGQYYLDRINRQLRSIEGEVKAVRQDLRNETYAEIAAAAQACVELEEALALTLDLTPDERMRLVSAERDIDKAYEQKRKDVEDFLSEVQALFARDKVDPKQAEKLLRDASNVRRYDVQLLARAAGVRHKLNVLRALVDESAEGGRGSLAQRKLDRELKEMRRDLEAALVAIRQLTLSRAEAKEKWELPFLRRPPKELDAFYPKGEQIADFLVQAPAHLLPLPETRPMLLEAFVDEAGVVRVLAQAFDADQEPPDAAPLALPAVGDQDRKRARLKVLKERAAELERRNDAEGLALARQQIAEVEAELGRG